ncbi:hypothetical protein BESB_084600 [Besnoitia besnoiti]|uniref:T-complex protein 10 C-terminus protein n=1 Tax=Besnoitia besnoiti TaxID=94643 RepID=A0A2A9MAC0_BESBE|nr:hypothetical protein BESB_084600 [Besnoitia besnoiti]PFH33261.1 hypothetical protein BESB_084600 [Besnoitia besnoiti]
MSKPLHHGRNAAIAQDKNPFRAAAREKSRRRTGDSTGNLLGRVQAARERKKSQPATTRGESMGEAKGGRREPKLSLHASADEASLRASYRSIGSSYRHHRPALNASASSAGERPPSPPLSPDAAESSSSEVARRRRSGGASCVRGCVRGDASQAPRRGKGDEQRVRSPQGGCTERARLSREEEKGDASAPRVSAAVRREAQPEDDARAVSGPASVKHAPSCKTAHRDAASHSSSSSSHYPASPTPLDWWREYPPPRAVPPSPPLRAPPDLLFAENARESPRKSPVNLDEVPVGLHSDGDFERLLEKALEREREASSSRPPRRPPPEGRNAGRGGGGGDEGVDSHAAPSSFSAALGLAFHGSTMRADSKEMRDVSPRPFLRKRGGLQAAFASRSQKSPRQVSTSVDAKAARKGASASASSLPCARAPPPWSPRASGPSGARRRDASAGRGREDERRRLRRPSFESGARAGSDESDAGRDDVSLAWTENPEDEKTPPADRGLDGTSRASWRSVPLREDDELRSQSCFSALETDGDDAAAAREAPAHAAPFADAFRLRNRDEALAHSFGEATIRGEGAAGSRRDAGRLSPLGDGGGRWRATEILPRSRDTSGSRPRGDDARRQRDETSIPAESRDMPLFASLNDYAQAGEVETESRENRRARTPAALRGESEEGCRDDADRRQKQADGTPQTGSDERGGCGGEKLVSPSAVRRAATGSNASFSTAECATEYTSSSSMQTGMLSKTFSLLTSEFDERANPHAEGRDNRALAAAWSPLSPRPPGPLHSVASAASSRPREKREAAHADLLRSPRGAGEESMPREREDAERDDGAREAPISDLVRAHFYAATLPEESRWQPATRRPSSLRKPGGREDDSGNTGRLANPDERDFHAQSVGQEARLNRNGDAPRRRGPRSPSQPLRGLEDELGDELAVSSPGILESKLELLRLQLQRLRDGEARLRRISAELQRQREEIAFERETMRTDVEEDRRLAWREVEAARQQLLKEKRRVERERERLRETLQQHQEQQERQRALQQRVDNLQEELRTSRQKWRTTVERLRREKAVLQEENSALKEELSLAEQQFCEATKMQRNGRFRADTNRNGAAKTGGPARDRRPSDRASPRQSMRTPRGSPSDGAQRVLQPDEFRGSEGDDERDAAVALSPCAGGPRGNGRQVSLPNVPPSRPHSPSGAAAAEARRLMAKARGPLLALRMRSDGGRGEDDRTLVAPARYPVNDACDREPGAASLDLEGIPQDALANAVAAPLSLSEWEEAVETSLHASALSPLLRGQAESHARPASPGAAAAPPREPLRESPRTGLSAQPPPAAPGLEARLREYEAQLRLQEERICAQQLELDRQQRLLGASRLDEAARPTAEQAEMRAVSDLSAASCRVSPAAASPFAGGGAEKGFPLAYRQAHAPLKRGEGDAALEARDAEFGASVRESAPMKLSSLHSQSGHAQLHAPEGTPSDPHERRREEPEAGEPPRSPHPTRHAAVYEPCSLLVQADARRPSDLPQGELGAPQRLHDAQSYRPGDKASNGEGGGAGRALPAGNDPARTHNNAVLQTPSYCAPSPTPCAAAALPVAPSPQFFSRAGREGRLGEFAGEPEGDARGQEADSRKPAAEGLGATDSIRDPVGKRRHHGLEPNGGPVGVGVGGPPGRDPHARAAAETQPKGVAPFDPKPHRRSMTELFQFDFEGPFQRSREVLFQLLKNPGDIAQERERTGKKELIYQSGLRRLLYDSGLQKVQATNGWMFVLFTNGDLRISTHDDAHLYHFAEQSILQYTLPDGKKYNRFADGQRELQFPDGHVQILFANGVRKEIFTNGIEEITFPDGAQQLKLPSSAPESASAVIGPPS